jgi:hypothetical protein
MDSAESGPLPKPKLSAGLILQQFYRSVICLSDQFLSFYTPRQRFYVLLRAAKKECSRFTASEFALLL